MLDKHQKKFIKTKVKKLGSLEKVKEFYDHYRKRNVLVDRFAVDYAKEIFKKRRKV